MTVNKNLKRKRWDVIDKLLQQGKTTYSLLEQACHRELNTEEDLYDLLRTDIKEIDKLLQKNGLPKIIRNKRGIFSYIDRSISILPYIKDRAPSIYFRQLSDMLSHSKGLIAENWLEEMHIHLQEENEEELYNQRIIEFEHNENFEADKFLPNFFKAIYDKNAISFQYKPYNGISYSILFHPHYLKQYHTIWYAYGSIENDKKKITEQCIALDRVASEPLIARNIPYHEPEINFNTYLEDIIGITKYAHQKKSKIYLQVKSNYYKRICNKPLHPSQCHYKDLDNEIWKGLILDVHINNELKRLLYSYADVIKVIGPASLMNDMKHFSRKIDEYYLK